MFHETQRTQHNEWHSTKSKREISSGSVTCCSSWRLMSSLFANSISRSAVSFTLSFNVISSSRMRESFSSLEHCGCRSIADLQQLFNNIYVHIRKPIAWKSTTKKNRTSTDLEVVRVDVDVLLSPPCLLQHLGVLLTIGLLHTLHGVHLRGHLLQLPAIPIKGRILQMHNRAYSWMGQREKCRESLVWKRWKIDEKLHQHRRKALKCNVQKSQQRKEGKWLLDLRNLTQASALQTARLTTFSNPCWERSSFSQVWPVPSEKWKGRRRRRESWHRSSSELSF